MHLPRFDYERLDSLENAGKRLGSYGASARLVAGGTDLFPRMKYGLLHPRVILDLKGIPLKPPAVDGKGNLHVSALTTLAALVRDPVVQEKAPLLADAALSVGSVQIRERATLGGNICLGNRCLYYNQSHTFQFTDPCLKRGGDLCYLIPGGKKCLAVFCADTVPALTSLDASLSVIGPGGIRRIPLEGLYTGDGARPLAISAEEVVAEVIVPVRPASLSAAFAKFSLREGMDFAAVSVAAAFTMTNAGGSCGTARITVGAVSARPRRALKAEEALKGQPLSPNIFRQAARIAAKEIAPVPHHGFSAQYLRECLEVQVRRALEAAGERALR